jgi:hypothetical protein
MFHRGLKRNELSDVVAAPAEIIYQENSSLSRSA